MSKFKLNETVRILKFSEDSPDAYGRVDTIDEKNKRYWVCNFNMPFYGNTSCFFNEDELGKTKSNDEKIELTELAKENLKFILLRQPLSYSMKWDTEKERVESYTMLRELGLATCSELGLSSWRITEKGRAWLMENDESMNQPLKIKELTINIVNYGDLEDMVRIHYPEFSDYSFVASEEVNNDSTHLYRNITKNPLVWNISDKDYFNEKKDRGDWMYATSNILFDLCSKGIIPEGNYLIDVSW